MDVFLIFEPSVAVLLSVAGETELLYGDDDADDDGDDDDANFGFLLCDNGLWLAFDRVRLAIQFFAFRSTGNSSSLLISMGSNLWRFNLFVDAVFTLDTTSPLGSFDSSCRRLTFRFEPPLPLSVLSNAFFLPRRFNCDSKLSANMKFNVFFPFNIVQPN